MGQVVLRQSEQSVRRAYLFYNLMLAGSFLFLYFGVTSVQSTAMRSAPPLGLLARLVSSVGRALEAAGLAGCRPHRQHARLSDRRGERRQHVSTLVFALVGVLAFWRRGRRTPLLLLLSPFAMGLAAASLGQYPYGGSARIMQYLVPSICLFAGLGGALWLVRTPVSRFVPSFCRTGAPCFWHFWGLTSSAATWSGRTGVTRIRKPTVCSLVLVGVLTAEPTCSALKKDLGLLFQPKHWKTGMSAVYLYHQKLYKRHAETELAETVFRQRFADDKPSVWCSSTGCPRKPRYTTDGWPIVSILIGSEDVGSSW